VGHVVLGGHVIRVALRGFKLGHSAEVARCLVTAVSMTVAQSSEAVHVSTSRRWCRWLAYRGLASGEMQSSPICR
jgi:hypothetical protein